MLDLSYSSYNLKTIFEIESRRRDMKDYMPLEYSSIVEDIKDYNKCLKPLKAYKYSSLSEADRGKYDSLKSLLEEAQNKKDKIIEKNLIAYSKLINSKSFVIDLIEKKRDEGLYTLDKDKKELFFLSKKLQHNLKEVFKVKQADRHLILSQLKLLLNEGSPKYLIRTDITKFYESIPQDKLLEIIEENRALDYKSKVIIRNILSDYEDRKDTAIFKKGYGVPRGIGISAPLSEIYMKEVDTIIKNLPGVIYYARYVDDIIIILNKIHTTKDISDTYSIISDIYKSYKLKLKPKSYTKKCRLVDLACITNVEKKFSMDYLGYRIDIVRKDKTTSAEFGISSNKKKKIKDRINKSIAYFNQESRYNIHNAKELLLLCLILLSHNIKLTGSKSRVKAGIYYSNILLDKRDEIDYFDKVLQKELKNITPYSKIFEGDRSREVTFISKLKKKILSKVNFAKGFENKTLTRISPKTREKILAIWE